MERVRMKGWRGRYEMMEMVYKNDEGMKGVKEYERSERVENKRRYLSFSK